MPAKYWAAAWLIHGSYGREVGMSGRTRRLLDDLWEYFGFLANARCEPHDLNTPARKTAQLGVCLNAFDEIGIFPGGPHCGVDVQAIRPVCS